MAWDDTTRHDHRRLSARYPSDMTDREWAVIAPLLPPAKAGGRPRKTDLRAVMDAILDIASGGCQWRMLQGFSATIHGAGLLLQVARQPSLGNDQPPPGPERAGAGRARRQSHGRRDRQPECEDDRERRPVGLRRGEEGQGPQAPHRYRHTRADALRPRSWGRCARSRRRTSPAQGDPSPLSLAAPYLCRWRLCGRQVARCAPGPGRLEHRDHQAIRHRQGLRALPRRWVVERTFAWLGRCRRLAKDWEKTIQSSTAWALVASIRLLSRRLARYCYPT